MVERVYALFPPPGAPSRPRGRRLTAHPSRARAVDTETFSRFYYADASDNYEQLYQVQVQVDEGNAHPQNATVFTVRHRAAKSGGDRERRRPSSRGVSHTDEIPTSKQMCERPDDDGLHHVFVAHDRLLYHEAIDLGADTSLRDLDPASTLIKNLTGVAGGINRVVATPDCKYVYVMHGKDADSPGMAVVGLELYDFDPAGPTLSWFNSSIGTTHEWIRGSWGWMNMSSFTYDPLDYRFPIVVQDDGYVERLVPGPAPGQQIWKGVYEVCTNCMTTVGDGVVVLEDLDSDDMGFGGISVLRRTGESTQNSTTNLIEYRYDATAWPGPLTPVGNSDYSNGDHDGYFQAISGSASSHDRFFLSANSDVPASPSGTIPPESGLHVVEMFTRG